MPQDKGIFMNAASSPIMEHQQERDDHLDDYEEETFSASGCNCFHLLSFKWRRHEDNERKYLLNQKGEQGDTWLVKTMKKMKEASELLAGPKWKTFIRKISGNVKNKKKQRNNQFQYDPESYALNFDGAVDREEEDDGLLPDFTSRLPVTPSR